MQVAGVFLFGLNKWFKNQFFNFFVLELGYFGSQFFGIFLVLMFEATYGAIIMFESGCIRWDFVDNKCEDLLNGFHDLVGNVVDVIDGEIVCFEEFRRFDAVAL